MPSIYACIWFKANLCDREKVKMSRQWKILGCSFLLIICFILLVTISVSISFDLGSIRLPAPLYAKFLEFYFPIGFAVLFLTGLLTSCFTHFNLTNYLTAQFKKIGDKQWIIIGSFISLLIPILIRLFVLHEVPITDDEFAYRFSAQLLANGKISLPSFPMKAFFDHLFLMNNGRMFSQYFLGWPALLSIGVFFKIPGFMNAFYGALTFPALFLITRELTDSFWAKVTSTIYLMSPMLMIAAATELSYTSCLMILMWLLWVFVRLLTPTVKINLNWNMQSLPLLYGLFSILFCIAFFIRPLSAIGFALPLLSVLVFNLFKKHRHFLNIVMFMLPAIAFAFLFLIINKVQTGAFFNTAYFAVSHYRTTELIYPMQPSPEFKLSNIGLAFNFFHGIVTTLTALLRLNFASFGWPCSFIFLFFVSFRKKGWIPWSILFSYLFFNFFVSDAGIDTFGPTHYFEILGPMFLLTAIGAKNLSDLFRKNNLKYDVLVLILTCFLLNACFYIPKRFAAIIRIAHDINFIPDVIKAKHIHNAIIFLQHQAMLYCLSYPTRHFVFWNVNYDVNLKNDVLYLHHISLEKDLQLMKYFPNRNAYIVGTKAQCDPVMMQISEAHTG